MTIRELLGSGGRHRGVPRHDARLPAVGRLVRDAGQHRAVVPRRHARARDGRQRRVRGELPDADGRSSNRATGWPSWCPTTCRASASGGRSAKGRDAFRLQAQGRAVGTRPRSARRGGRPSARRPSWSAIPTTPPEHVLTEDEMDAIVQVAERRGRVDRGRRDLSRCRARHRIGDADVLGPDGSGRRSRAGSRRRSRCPACAWGGR